MTDVHGNSTQDHASKVGLRTHTGRPGIRLRPQIAFMVRWEPEIDCCTGEGGVGLFKGLLIWWRVRRGTWRDDDLPLWGDELDA